MLHIVYSNIVVAIATGVLCAGFCFALKIEAWLYYGFFAFFATFAVYNGQRLIKSAQPIETPWLIWVKRNEKLLLLGIVLALLGTLGSLYLIAKFSIAAAAWLGLSGIISFFYVVRVKETPTVDAVIPERLPRCDRAVRMQDDMLVLFREERVVLFQSNDQVVAVSRYGEVEAVGWRCGAARRGRGFPLRQLR